jgi:hypothetical protein
MLVQEMSEDPVVQLQTISQDMEETYETREDPLKDVEMIHEDRESRNKFMQEEKKK